MKRPASKSAKALISQVGKTGKIAVDVVRGGRRFRDGRVGGFKRYIEKNSQLQIVGTYYSQRRRWPRR